MSKIITIRLSDEEYKKIALSAKNEHRPISNFITYAVMCMLEENYYTDAIETREISLNERLAKKLEKGHRDAAKMKGRLIG